MRKPNQNNNKKKRKKENLERILRMGSPRQGGKHACNGYQRIHQPNPATGKEMQIGTGREQKWSPWTIGLRCFTARSFGRLSQLFPIMRHFDLLQRGLNDFSPFIRTQRRIGYTFIIRDFEGIDWLFSKRTGDPCIDRIPSDQHQKLCLRLFLVFFFFLCMIIHNEFHETLMRHVGQISEQYTCSD